MSLSPLKLIENWVINSEDTPPSAFSEQPLTQHVTEQHSREQFVTSITYTPLGLVLNLFNKDKYIRISAETKFTDEFNATTVKTYRKLHAYGTSCTWHIIFRVSLGNPFLNPFRNLPQISPNLLAIEFPSLYTLYDEKFLSGVIKIK